MSWKDRLFDLRVDDSAEPLQELRRLVTLQRAYNHMNAGDLAVEKKDNEGALREYSAAEKLVPGNAEMIYWHAVALVNMGRVDESLPLFRKVFAMDKNWATLTPRLPKAGLLPNDPKLIERILAVSPKYRQNQPCLGSFEFNPFATKFQGFDCHFAVFGVQARPLIFLRERIAQSPSCNFITFVIQQNYHRTPTVQRALQQRAMPVVKVARSGHATLQRDVAKLCQARQFSRDVVAALPVFDDLNFRPYTANFGKAGYVDPVDLDSELVVFVRVESCCHFTPPVNSWPSQSCR